MKHHCKRQTSSIFVHLSTTFTILQPWSPVSHPLNATQSSLCGGGWGGRVSRAHFLPTTTSFTCHKPLGPYALQRRPCSPQGPEAGHRSMAVIREGNYTHNLFNGPQVQQRREAHKDSDQGGLLLHRREQEVQEHISESFSASFIF